MSRCLLAMLLSVGLIVPVAAQPVLAPKPASAAVRVETGPAWNDLPASQQAALAPLKQHWAGIDSNRKTKWLVVSQRFPAMPAAERERVQARMAEWATLTPTERGKARQSFQELRNLHPDDRQALWEAYRALPDEQKRELAQRAKPPARAAEPASGATPKRNLSVSPPPTVAKVVAPTVVQARPGATTTLLTKAPSPPAHHQPGLPKITATEGFVNPATLLPNRGPQGAAAHASAASTSAESARP